eukprot:593620-Pelagomonas_calceolata.AAC.2
MLLQLKTQWVAGKAPLRLSMAHEQSGRLRRTQGDAGVAPSCLSAFIDRTSSRAAHVYADALMKFQGRSVPPIPNWQGNAMLHCYVCALQRPCARGV